MRTDSFSGLARQLRASLRELSGLPEPYSPLIRHLERLLDKAEHSELDLQALRETEAVFLRYPRLQPMRAAAATEDGLEATRSVLVEIKNRIITFDGGSADPTKAEPSEASGARSQE